ncbi:MAG: flagellar hook protein FlgE, partial [Treponema sp.]|nr:flagellar hook protein FlgE [Treponema sp.]
GLQNHQTRMDVIGNNISNINTTGFKKNRALFQDMMYQQLSGAARPTDTLGGINPKEVGLGMSVATIDTLHTQGTLETTGKGTDLAIQGTGFFVLKDGEQTFYTRAGAFGVDKDGTMMNPANGLRVQGWMAEDAGNTQIINSSADTTDLIIPVGSKEPARATTMVNFACNLDNRTPIIPEGTTDPASLLTGTWSTSIKVYDNFGEAHIMQVDFTRVPGVNNQWTAAVTADPDYEVPSNTSIGLAGVPPAVGEGNTFTVTFDNNGLLESVMDANGNMSTETGAVLMNVAFDVQSSTPGDDGAPIRQELTLNLGQVGGVVNTMTQFAERSSTKANEQDGYPMGYLENFKIDNSGMITGVYSNGVSRLIGQVAMASFANQDGLEKAGDNNFVESNNSGLANVSTSGIAGKGKIVAGTLEMSNVDMASEFTNLIVTQRGFQANSKTIQTADQLLQELLTLKR